MHPTMPRLDDLLALLEVFFAPERGALPGGRRPRQSLRPKLVFRPSPPPPLPPPPPRADWPSPLVIPALDVCFGLPSPTFPFCSIRHDFRPAMRVVTLPACTPFDFRLRSSRLAKFAYPLRILLSPAGAVQYEGVACYHDAMVVQIVEAFAGDINFQ
ncbi:uncharacterized protein FSUBG_7690 [Fusarium subglutinans]|uniref:Uncharacterized protein n=1 Tax=Gibberella subglutinans TaxID=42677 RepID=A0A8H5PTL3_GIBSU|nr:uncharacterized protein FSUBG_7690 [Fusarium subglutinans]KAF5602383.1 hypothetical protein FSUBG_7690 [Fusarium subglutinans]